MTRRLFILDSAAAARAWLAKETPKAEDEILSTHCSVVGFLAARHIACRDFSSFITVGQARTEIQQAGRDLDATLSHLDRTLGARICSAAELPNMAIFNRLFKYLGQYNFAGLRVFENILTARIAHGPVSSVYYWHALATSNHAVFSFVEAAAKVCEAHRISFSSVAAVPSRASRLITGFAKLIVFAKKITHSPRELLRAISHRLPRPRALISPGDRVAIVFAHPTSSSFFTIALSKRGVRTIAASPQGIAAVRGIGVEQAQARLKKVLETAMEWQRSAMPTSRSDDNLAKRMVSHLIQHASSLLLPMLHAHVVIRDYPVCFAASDLPLVASGLNLVAELFMASGLPVMGRQHGSAYGDQDCGTIHFDSDFNRCTHFFSYGFGQKEFEATYPNARPTCVFVPAGNPPLSVKRSAKPVDIVFPIQSSIELFFLARMPESELVHRANCILEALEERTDLSCVVKPAVNYSEVNFTHPEALRKLRHTRIVRRSWTSYLQAYRPRLIVFEIASTPLFEALSLDVDIFLMLDPVYPFSDAAFELLQKRVHIFGTTEEMTEAIRHYGVATLQHLRNDEFYRTYVNCGSADSAFDFVFRQIGLK